MHFESRFVVSGTPQLVLEHFANVPLMASFLPGASVGVPSDDGTYPATLVASFGPKKIAFSGSLTNSVDNAALAGVLVGQASADVRGARIGVKMNYSLSTAAPSVTQVRLESDAQLTGVLADFANAGGAIVAEALIAEFARRFSDHVEARTAGTALTEVPRAATLSAFAVFVALMRRLKQRLWRAT